MKKKKKVPEEGTIFGPWTLVEKIGSGGNGDVWRTSREGYEDHAIKLLKSVRGERFERFKSEIAVLTDNDDIEGIVPLLDRIDLESTELDIPWFVMPLATEFCEYRKDKSPLELASDFLVLADTLDVLHSRGIFHRDIKPANVLLLEGKLSFSDFGLVKYPDKEDLTPDRRDVGAKFTMAPEMRRHANSANGLPADVYSFAKTLWIALTRQSLGFDGQYTPDSIIGLRKYVPELYTASLDRLLGEATDNDPERRPTIHQFSERLRHWIEINQDFHGRNLTEWFELENMLFATVTPDSASWTDIDAICSVLKEISKVKSLNHMMFPEGGGHTITGISKPVEEGTIALHVGAKSAYILKPQKLSFESFGFDPQWNYFRLEAAEIVPSGVQDAHLYKDIKEELTEVEPGIYEHRNCWEYNEYHGQPLDDIARPVSRYVKGSFVFFSTRSIYNLTSATYDARHDEMSEEEFRAYIKRNADSHQQINNS